MTAKWRKAAGSQHTSQLITPIRNRSVPAGSCSGIE
jgi:hypothetical protein